MACPTTVVYLADGGKFQVMNRVVTRSVRARAAASRRARTGLGLALRHILVPTDFSDISRWAFTMAMQWARNYRARITLLYVVPEVLPAHLTEIGLVLRDKRRAVDARRKLGELRLRVFPSDLQVMTRVREGGPAYEIAKFAREAGVDLIIMSTHGYTGLRHLCLGSTTEKVLRQAPCSVLAVRPRGARRVGVAVAPA